MALITICGYPCSGKSTRAQQIQTYLQSKLTDPTYAGPQLELKVISDETLNLPRSVYNDSKAEKPARGSLLSAMQRHANGDTILVVDAPNYIKGFRYQMYCIARELKLRVYVIATPAVCKERNEVRIQEGAENAYAPETLDNLIMRFEEPSSMVRWDSPLFSVLWTDADIPGQQIWEAVTSGDVKPPNAGTQAVPKAPTDALHTLEQTSSSIVAGILAEQSASGGSFASFSSSPISITVTPTLKTPISLPPRTLTLSELQRLKRQFVTVHKKAITLGTVEKGRVDWDEEAVAGKFGRYLEENLKM